MNKEWTLPRDESWIFFVSTYSVRRVSDMRRYSQTDSSMVTRKVFGLRHPSLERPSGQSFNRMIVHDLFRMDIQDGTRIDEGKVG